MIIILIVCDGGICAHNTAHSILSLLYVCLTLTSLYPTKNIYFSCRERRCPHAFCDSNFTLPGKYRPSFTRDMAVLGAEDHSHSRSHIILTGYKGSESNGRTLFYLPIRSRGDPYIKRECFADSIQHTAYSSRLPDSISLAIACFV